MCANVPSSRPPRHTGAPMSAHPEPQREPHFELHHEHTGRAGAAHDHGAHDHGDHEVAGREHAGHAHGGHAHGGHGPTVHGPPADVLAAYARAYAEARPAPGRVVVRVELEARETGWGFVPGYLTGSWSF